MEALKEWVRSLVVLTVLGTCLELAVPQQAYRGYVRMVLGLMVMLSMLGPLLKLAGQPVPISLDAALPVDSMGAADRLAPTVPDGTSATVDRLNAARESNISREYGRQVAAAAAAIARGIPGVTGARATVDLQNDTPPGQPPPVAAVRLILALGGSVPVTAATGESVQPVVPVQIGAGPGESAGRDGRTSVAAAQPITAAVVRSVSQHLGIPAAQVIVAVETEAGASRRQGGKE